MYMISLKQCWTARQAAGTDLSAVYGHVSLCSVVQVGRLVRMQSRSAASSSPSGDSFLMRSLDA